MEACFCETEYQNRKKYCALFTTASSLFIVTENSLSQIWSYYS